MTEAQTLDLSPAGALVPDERSASGMQMATTTPPLPTNQAMIAQAIASGNIDVIGKVMDYQERWDRMQARKAFDAAIAAAKAEIPVIAKNRTVDFTGKTGIRTHYKHEDLAEIARTVDPILARHGLSYRFRTTSDLNQPVAVTCIVSHAAGHYEENTLSGPRDDSGNKNAIQQVGSTITFLQRYTLKAALGLAAAADDDGRGAGGNLDEPQYITAEQAKAIDDRCAAEGVNVDKLCMHFKVTSIENILAKDHDGVIRVLNQRKADKEIKARKKEEAA